VSAYCICVSIRTDEFVNRSHQRKLTVSTDITEEIYRISEVLLRELWNGKTPLRLIGVSLSDIDRKDAVQLSIFDNDEGREKKRKLDKAVDEIRRKFGQDTIIRGGAGHDVGKKFRARAEIDREDQK